MFIRKINYTVTPDGITPLSLQRGGLQGEHNATGLIFNISSELLTKLSVLADVGNDIFYRFEAYTGTGLKNSTIPKPLETDSGEVTLTYPLEHWLTRDGGNIRIYLIISAIENISNDTSADIYSYPALIRLDAVPEAELTDGENYDSLATLSVEATRAAEAAEESAEAAEASAIAADQARTLTEEARLALENGAEFIFLGGDSESALNTDLIIDEELSDVSENPVQNRAVTEALNETLEELANTKGTVGGLEQYIGDVHNRVLACEEKVDKLSSTVNGLPIPADYIVEQGYDGGWFYEKWASGVAKCYGTKTDTPDISDEFGTLYQSTEAYGCAKYPVEFVEGPYFSADVSFCTGSTTPIVNIMYAGYEYYSGVEGWSLKTHTPCWMYLRPKTSAVTQTVTVSMMAVGRWK